jgi:hypothetical protein
MDFMKRGAEEFKFISSLMRDQDQNPEDPKTKYAFDAGWIERYKDFMQSKGPFNHQGPGSIDNKDIERKARKNVLKETDYFTVSEDVAKFMLMMYGGGPVISLYNIHEMIEECKHKLNTNRNSLSAHKDNVLEDMSSHHSMSAFSDISSLYSRPKKTKSALEQRYANPKGYVAERGHLLDESSSIYNCKHPGDVPAEMDDEDFNNGLNPALRVPKSRQLSDVETVKSDEKQSILSRPNPMKGINFKESMEKYIDNHKKFGKNNIIDFDKVHKAYIHKKLSENLDEMTSNYTSQEQEVDPLLPLYSFPGIDHLPARCNSLENPLCYCYLNSVLQFLFTIKEIMYYFSKDPENRLQSLKVAKQFKKVVDEYQSHDRRQLDATSFLVCFRSKIEINTQQDVDELLRLVLDQIHQELRPQTKRHGMTSAGGKSAWLSYCVQENSLMTYLFTGETKRRTVCFNCQYASEITETFDILSLSLSSDNKTLEDVISSNFACELIDEGFQCSSCKRLAPATSKLFLTRLPRYLIVQLKRFSLFPKPCKVTQEIKYDNREFLDLKRHSLTNHSKYELQSVVHHSGTIGNGHYRVSGLRGDKVT